MADELGPSDWTVGRARRIARSMIDVAEDRTFAAVEHFEALCEYLDDLHGGSFDRLLEPDRRSAVAALIARLRGSSRRVDRADRLRRPVNSSLTLDEGRALTGVPAQEGFDAELASALQGVYRYADELHGGPGAFTDLLEADEREQVAALVLASRPPAVEPDWLDHAAEPGD